MLSRMLSAMAVSCAKQPSRLPYWLGLRLSGGQQRGSERGRDRHSAGGRYAGHPDGLRNGFPRHGFRGTQESFHKPLWWLL